MVALGIERSESIVQLEENHAQRPDIDLVVVRLLTHYFRSNIQGRTFHRSEAHGHGRHLPGKPKVADLDHPILNQDILGFQISVYYPVVV